MGIFNFKPKKIKLRVWHRNLKEMYQEIYGFDERRIGYRDNDGKVRYFSYGQRSKKVFVIMQYIGAFDKNSNEIAEGDIVKDPQGRLCVVIWVDKFASFGIRAADWAFTHYFGEACEPNEVVIVGNVFENEELLQ